MNIIYGLTMVIVINATLFTVVFKAVQWVVKMQESKENGKTTNKKLS